MLRAVEITRAFGGQVVLDAVSVQLDPGDRVGLVGPNGAGKTTLLRLLAGLDVPDGGRVELAPATLTVGYLPQEPEPQPGETLLAHLERRTGVAAAERALDAATDALAADASALDDYTVALERFLALGGDDFAARAAEVCDRVGLAGMVAAGGARRASTAARFDQEVASLSGGEAARVALAAILLSRADVLLLDEPTNNLDFAGIDLLEAFVDGFTGGVLVVSHDRAFLDRCVDRIVELDDHDHHARAFAGGWSAYVAARELARSQHDAAFARYVAERDRLRARQRRQVQWSETGVRRAKTSGEPDKNLRRKRAERSEKQASKVKATERKLAQLERVDKPWEPWQLRLALRPEARSGQVVARLDGAVVERGGDGGFRLGPVDLEIAWQDRLAILGPNGSGKSTLLGALLGELPLAAGGRWLGPGVRVGLLDQDRAGFGGDEPVLRVFQRETGLPRDEARSLLAKFRLGAEHVDRAGSALSPGERTRAVVAVLMAQGVNCLVLDEPTNHLDVEAIEQLEQALAGFDGTLVVVSHDRRFLEALEITRVLDLGAAGA